MFRACQYAFFGCQLPAPRTRGSTRDVCQLDFGTFYVIHGKGTSIVGDRQIAWSQGDFFTTPGYWHEHRNESGERAYLTPIQDARLHTYLRTLDITFYKDDE